MADTVMMAEIFGWEIVNKWKKLNFYKQQIANSMQPRLWKKAKEKILPVPFLKSQFFSLISVSCHAWTLALSTLHLSWYS